MPMHRDRLDKILRSYLDGSCTEQERQWIDLWLLKRGHNENVNLTEEQGEKAKDILYSHVQDLLKKEDGEQDHAGPSIRKRTVNWRYALPLAAAIVCIVFSGIFFWNDKTETKGGFSIGEMAGGVTKPTNLVITAFGKDYPIDSLPLGVEQQIGGAFIRRIANNGLEYRASAPEARIGSTTASHTVSVPAGRELHLRLPDGSLVWLNTGSTLRFPTVFAASERKLYLSGEAFFDVVSDKQHPFMVYSAGFHVEATGTQFHVYAYADEEVQTATLVEGKIAVGTDDHVRQLLPHQQWETKNGGQARVSAVDVNPILGKKEGYFVFDNQNIQEIMKEVSRWYDIEVHLDGKVEEMVLGGTFARKRSLDELLDYLSILTGCQFKKEGRRVIIMR